MAVYVSKAVLYVHRVSSDRYFPFHVCVVSEGPPGEVIYSHPDADEDCLIPDGAAWTATENAPAGAVRGHLTTPASVVRARAGAAELALAAGAAKGMR
jgi:hypothetical protein